MALSAEEIVEIEKALSTPGAIKDDAYRAWARDQLEAARSEHLEGWGKAAPHPLDSQPTAPGALGLKGVMGREGKLYGAGGVEVPNDAAAPDDAEVLAGQMDPRFDLIPQALSLLPATTHPGGDEAAAAQAASGQPRGETGYAYEPPVSLVQKQLIENPAFARMLRPKEPPSLEEISSMSSSSSLYQSASDWMWRKTAEAAAKGGRTVYRYSKLPYLWGETASAAGGAPSPQAQGTLDALKLSIGGAGKPLIDASNSFVMGVDNTAALGLGRAGVETLQPETKIPEDSGDYMGVNEATPQSTADVDRWNIEQHPIAHGLGQLYGLTRKWGAAEQIFQGVKGGGRYVADAIAKTRLGGLAGANGAARVAGRAALDAAAGGVAAGGEELGRQAVAVGAQAAQTGEAPSLGRLAEAGERVRDVGESGAQWGGAGSLIGSAAHAGAEHLRGSSQFSDQRGPGLIGRTEKNLDWGPKSIIKGPGLDAETKRVLKAAGNDQPGDIIAQEIAPAIRDAAAENTRRATGRGLAERSNIYQTSEGATAEPMTHLQEMSLEELRRHHQPKPGGGLHPVSDKFKPAQKVFNSLIDDVSMAPIEGATKLTPDEAERFLGARARHKLLKDDIGAAAERQAKQTFDRKALLEKVDPRKRAAVDEEIQASIDDLLQERGGDRALDADQRRAEYKAAEQQVLRDVVGEQMVLEPFDGSFGGYLKQRGIGAVYVKPQAYDAKRADALIEGLDGKLLDAAKLDRQRRPLGGQKGGYAALLKKQDDAVREAETIEKDVAPNGDAFKPIAGLYQSSPGEKQLVDRVRALAEQSGTREQLDRLRGLQSTVALRNRAAGRGAEGRTRLFGPSGWDDALTLRAFPALKALEGPLGPLGGGMAGRAALLGQDEPKLDVEPSKRSRYEDARKKQLADAERERDEEKEKRAKRAERRAAGR